MLIIEMKSLTASVFICNIRNVKFIKVMQFKQLFVTAVCVLFLLKLKWPKSNNFYFVMVYHKMITFSFHYFLTIFLSFCWNFFLFLLGICLPSRACAMESVGSSFRKKQIGNTQPRRYISRLLKVLSQSYESRESRDLALNSLAVMLNIKEVSNLLLVIKMMLRMLRSGEKTGLKYVRALCCSASLAAHEIHVAESRHVIHHARALREKYKQV